MENLEAIKILIRQIKILPLNDKRRATQMAVLALNEQIDTPKYKRAFELLADYVANSDALHMLSSPTAREKRKQIIIEDYLKKAEREAKH